jgi:hypothetical protein
LYGCETFSLILSEEPYIEAVAEQGVVEPERDAVTESWGE